MKAGPIILLSLAALLPGSPPMVEAQEGDAPKLAVLADTLANGLQLFILRRPGVPIASFVVQYRIGGVNEKQGSTGIAHLLEHLLFKGTTTVGTVDYEREAPLLAEMDRVFDSVLILQDRRRPDSVRISSLRARIDTLEKEAAQYVAQNEFDKILSENGARGLNAMTTSESTTYFVELPANRTELWFVLEADRMQNPVFREFFTEREVVGEERRLRLENNPGGLLNEALLAAAFHIHPYGRPVVGYNEDLERLSRRDVQSYFRNFYGPNNAVVAIAGDVDPEQIRAWAEKYLGPVPRGGEPPPVRAVEPDQRGERRVEVVYDAEPSLRIGWKVPEAQAKDGPALYMLTYLLTGGRNSRLYHRLVLEDGIASGVTSSVEPGQMYPGLFTIQASPLHPHSALELEEAIYEELEDLRQTPPEEAELQRVRNQLEASEIRRLESNFGLALQVAGSATLYGDWRATFEFSEKLREVSPADIQRVVSDYFRKETRTVATLVRPFGNPGGHR